MKRFILASESVRENLKRVIDAIDLTKKPFLEVIIKTYRKKKSWEQDKYLHGVVYKIISDFTGYTEDELHDLLKPQFLEPKIVEVGGFRSKVYSTKGKDTKEMAEFTEKVCRWAAMELGVYIPKPGEDYDVS